MAPDLRSFITINGKLTDNAAFFLSEDLVHDYNIFNPKWVQRFVKKFETGIPDSIGYRDNMIITFILSTQISKYWAKHPKKSELSGKLLTKKINEYE